MKKLPQPKLRNAESKQQEPAPVVISKEALTTELQRIYDARGALSVLDLEHRSQCAKYKAWQAWQGTVRPGMVREGR